MLFPVIEQLGLLVDTVLLQLLVQDPLLTVTEYVAAELTVIHCVVAPVLHRYDDIPEGAQSVVEVPGQIVLFPVIEQLGEETLTVTLHVLLQVPSFTLP